MFGLYDEQPKCGNEEPHMFHEYEHTDVRICSGIVYTECRTKIVVHPQHDYDVLVTEWCNGVCTCTNREGKHDHGPGRHK